MWLPNAGHTALLVHAGLRIAVVAVGDAHELPDPSAVEAAAQRVRLGPAPLGAPGLAAASGSVGVSLAARGGDRAPGRLTEDLRPEVHKERRRW